MELGRAVGTVRGWGPCTRVGSCGVERWWCGSGPFPGILNPLLVCWELCPAASGAVGAGLGVVLGLALRLGASSASQHRAGSPTALPRSAWLWGYRGACRAALSIRALWYPLRGDPGSPCPVLQPQVTGSISCLGCAPTGRPAGILGGVMCGVWFLVL